MTLPVPGWATVKSEPQEITEVLVKYQDVYEGQWDIFIEFDVRATSTPASDGG